MDVAGTADSYSRLDNRGMLANFFVVEFFPLWQVLYIGKRIRDRQRMKCEHTSCGTAEKVWLPYEVDGAEKGFKPHPYCIHCGTIKNISSGSDRPKSIGYYINALAEMGKYPGKKRCFTKVQMRVIVKELEDRGDFCDTYWVTGAAQDRIFISVVQKYCKISEGHIKSFL